MKDCPAAFFAGTLTPVVCSTMPYLSVGKSGGDEDDVGGVRMMGII